MNKFLDGTWTKKNTTPDNAEVDKSEVISPAKKTKFEMDILSMPQLFWKSTKPKYTWQLFSCKACNDINYNNPEKFQVISDRLFISHSLCTSCVKANYDITDIHIKNTKY